MSVWQKKLHVRPSVIAAFNEKNQKSVCVFQFVKFLSTQQNFS